MLLQAFKQLEETNTSKKLRLILASKIVKKSTHDNLEELVQNLNLEEKCILTGWVSSDEVRGILSACDILVLPQINHTFNKAGLPTKLAEYAAIGKPIIATNVGDVLDYFEHEKNIIIVPPSNVEELKKGIESLVENESLRQNIASNVEVVVNKNFDLEINARRIKKAIEELNSL